MNQSIYEFRDYKRYLITLTKTAGRGFKKALAQAAQCQTTYISQVLGGRANFSLEQAQAAGGFLGLTPNEVFYFLLLVQKARAGTAELRNFLDKRIDEEHAKYLLIRERVKIKNTLSEEAKAEYYSSWQYAAVHLLLTIPQYQEPRSIAKRLHLPLRRVSEILGFLGSVGLAEQKGGKYLPGQKQLYLEKTSPLISKHHTNWRMKAIQSFENGASEDQLHFSSVFTLTLDVAEKIRHILVKTIEETVHLVKQAPEEELVAMNVDFFEL
jgi:uncharacterized protein (TIGR02147 family)